MIDFELHAPTAKPEFTAVILAPQAHGEIQCPGLVRIGGKSLLAHSLICAMNAQSVSEIIVVTDDEQTALAAGRLGRGEKPVRVTQLRGEYSTLRALEHAAALAGADRRLLCALHVAAPLRASFDVDAAAALFAQTLAARDEARPLALSSVAAFPRNSSLEKLRWVVRDAAFAARLDGARAGLGRHVYAFGEDAPHMPNAELCAINHAITMLTRQTLAQWAANPLDGMPAERLAYIMPEERALEIVNEHDLRCARAIMGLRNSTTVVAPALAA